MGGRERAGQIDTQSVCAYVCASVAGVFQKREVHCVKSVHESLLPKLPPTAHTLTTINKQNGRV